MGAKSRGNFNIPKCLETCFCRPCQELRRRARRQSRKYFKLDNPKQDPKIYRNVASGFNIDYLKDPTKFFLPPQ